MTGVGWCSCCNLVGLVFTDPLLGRGWALFPAVWRCVHGAEASGPHIVVADIGGGFFLNFKDFVAASRRVFAVGLVWSGFFSFFKTRSLVTQAEI